GPGPGRVYHAGHDGARLGPGPGDRPAGRSGRTARRARSGLRGAGSYPGPGGAGHRAGPAGPGRRPGHRTADRLPRQAAIRTVNPDAALKARAKPHRRVILDRVADAPRPVGDIASHLDITPQAVSRHLKVLRDAGLVDEHREGTRHLLLVNPGRFSA